MSGREIALGTYTQCVVYPTVIEGKEDDDILLVWLAGEGIRTRDSLNLYLEPGSCCDSLSLSW